LTADQMGVAVERGIVVFDDDSPPGQVSERLLGLLLYYASRPDSQYADRPTELWVESGVATPVTHLAVKVMPMFVADLYRATGGNMQGKKKLVAVMGEKGWPLLGVC
jgi:hypothetical protein